VKAAFGLPLIFIVPLMYLLLSVLSSSGTVLASALIV
jgi:hypothetical protein